MRVLMRMVAIVLCCLTLAGLLTGCAAAASATPTPTVDPVTQAYLSVLRSSYGPYYDAAASELNGCYTHLLNATQTQLEDALHQCLPLETAAHDSTKNALAQLATATPPTRWQKADAGLKQALQAILPYYAARTQAIIAGSIQQFTGAFNDIANQSFTLFCDPINTFNAGPPQISPPLQAPYGNCGGPGSSGG